MQLILREQLYTEVGFVTLTGEIDVKGLMLPMGTLLETDGMPTGAFITVRVMSSVPDHMLGRTIEVYTDAVRPISN